MAKVIERFRDLFLADRTVSVTPMPQLDEEAAKEIQERRVAAIRDARVAVHTEFFKEYRTRLELEIGSLSPDPRLGSDVALCTTFKREGLMEARRMLDLMVRLAEEKIADE